MPPEKAFQIPQPAVKDPSDYWLHIMHRAVLSFARFKCFIYLFRSILWSTDVQFCFNFSVPHCGRHTAHATLYCDGMKLTEEHTDYMYGI